LDLSAQAERYFIRMPSANIFAIRGVIGCSSPENIIGEILSVSDPRKNDRRKNFRDADVLTLPKSICAVRTRSGSPEYQAQAWAPPRKPD
jgi:hypothetical protein